MRVILTAVVIVALGSGVAGTVWYVANIEPPLHPVKGFVFLDGQPMIRGAIITEHSKGWPGALAGIADDGSFSFTTNGALGAYEGRHTISFTLMDGGFPPSSLLPAKYTDPKQSPFSIDVSATMDEKALRFELTGKLNKDKDAPADPASK
jgi:hypothetical protein